ncbi:hypothetical protein HZ326_19287 [Fusarium oxysporum f. sp. albedinis]|nr:hypothetical protein HZ326_19287 [Fusarium oxysporum f. sp. albedinis]
MLTLHTRNSNWLGSSGAGVTKTSRAGRAKEKGLAGDYPGPLASYAIGFSLSENHTTRAPDRVCPLDWGRQLRKEIECVALNNNVY